MITLNFALDEDDAKFTCHFVHVGRKSTQRCMLVCMSACDKQLQWPSFDMTLQLYCIHIGGTAI